MKLRANFNSHYIIVWSPLAQKEKKILVNLIAYVECMVLKPFQVGKQGCRNNEIIRLNSGYILKPEINKDLHCQGFYFLDTMERRLVNKAKKVNITYTRYLVKQNHLEACKHVANEVSPSPRFAAIFFPPKKNYT